MSKLKEFLEDRLRQLQDRKLMIPRYVKRKTAFIGKKDFSLDDLPKIKYEIDETLAALEAVEDFRLKFNREQKVAKRQTSVASKAK